MRYYKFIAMYNWILSGSMLYNIESSRVLSIDMIWLRMFLFNIFKCINVYANKKTHVNFLTNVFERRSTLKPQCMQVLDENI